MAAGWTTRLFGLTYEPSTAARGVESWISSLADTRASRSVTPGVNWDRTILDTYGPKSPELQPRLSLDWSTSKTSVLTCGSDSVKSQATYKQWATSLRRYCLQRQKLARPTAASDCSSSGPKERRPDQWLTPTARDYLDGANPTMKVGTNGLLGRQAPRISVDGKPSYATDPNSPRRWLNPLFVEWLMGWPEGWVDVRSSISSGTE